MLNSITHGSPTHRQPLLIVHGLYGSARNWGVIAKRLSDDRSVIAVDQRNHGHSPWAAPHDYPSMAADLIDTITDIGTPMAICGHSMGGKAAMIAAIKRPDLVSSLIVADIAPVTYTHDQTPMIDAMRAVDLSRVEKRSDATEQLAQHIDDPALQSFFTQSLDLKEKRWRLNLDQIATDMEAIIGFPEITGAYTGPTLFLTGANSTYVLPEYRDRIKTLFPAARFAKLPGAGHWLHADKPREFEAACRAFLNATDPT